MRRPPLGFLVALFLALHLRAADAPFSSAAVQARWPGSLALIEKVLAAGSPQPAKERASVDAALHAAESFISSESLPPDHRAQAKAAAARDFKRGIDALGPRVAAYLGRDGGLGVIAVEVLGPEALLEAMNLGGTAEPEPADKLSMRADALYKSGRYDEANAAARRAWELSGRRDEKALVIIKFTDGRTAPKGEAKEFAESSGKSAAVVASPAAVSGSVFTAKHPKQEPLIVPGVSATTPPKNGDLVPSLTDLVVKKAAYDGWREAAAAAPMPVPGAQAAFDRSSAIIDRDLKLRQAAQSAAQWLENSRDRKSRALLEDLSDSRRAVLADAVSRAAAIMDRSESGREDLRVRTALLNADAPPEDRAEAARSLLALRGKDPAFFSAKAAGLDYIRFNREHLADYPSGTKISGAELGMPLPPNSGLARIDYQTTKDGRLVPARLVAEDGSARERGAVAGAWTIRDKDGLATGWSLDAGAFAAMDDPKARGAAVATAAQWLSDQGFKAAAGRDQSAATASMLGDLLGRTEAGVKGMQLYANRADGTIIADSYYDKGVKQRMARAEPGTEGLALYERAVTDPNDQTTPWRKVMLYRGSDERDLLTMKVDSNADAARRIVTGTSVEVIPIAVQYHRDSNGRWARDGKTQEFPEQRQIIHDSAGVLGGSGEVFGVAGRGATDLAASAIAAGGALTLYPARAIPRAGSLVAEVQRDWFERAGVNLVNNAVSTDLGRNYGGDAYTGPKAAMNLDERKYVQNVRQELTDQGQPMLGAVAGAGVAVSNNMIPLIVGFGAVQKVAGLGPAGRYAMEGVGLVMSGKGGWDFGISVNEFNHARKYDHKDPIAAAEYYSTIQNLTEQGLNLPLLLGGLNEAVHGRIGTPGRTNLTNSFSGKNNSGSAAIEAEIPLHAVETTVEFNLRKPPIDPAHAVDIPVDPVQAAKNGLPLDVYSRKIKNDELFRKRQFIADLEKAGISYERIMLMEERACPLSFESVKQFNQFKAELAVALKSSGLSDAKANMKGTSTTYYSYNPGKPLGHRFDANPQELADIDMNIQSQKLAILASKPDAVSSKGNVIKTSVIEDHFPVLEAFAAKWRGILKRDVAFVGQPTVTKPDDGDWFLTGAAQ